MNTLARYASLAAALGALLLFSGCFTTRTAGTLAPRVEYQATVMETSKGLEVTPQLLADLRASAINYLKDNGFTKGGEYYLRINLTPDRPEDTDQWVVLRISSLPTRTYTLLAAYPGADDYYPYDFYGYYNYGFPSFARYGYYDPYDYGYGYGGSYIPPGREPNRYHKPGDKDGNRPPPTRTRWDGNRPDPDDKDGTKTHQPNPNSPRRWDNNNRPRTNDRPRDNDDGRRWSPRGGNTSNPDTPHPASSGSSSNYTPSSPPSYSPPPAPSYSAPSYSPPPPASRSESSTQVREERTLPQNEK